jgi:hypothetical protein
MYALAASQRDLVPELHEPAQVGKVNVTQDDNRLNALQYAHDHGFTPAGMEVNLRRLAKDYRLSIPEDE